MEHWQSHEHTFIEHMHSFEKSRSTRAKDDSLLKQTSIDLRLVQGYNKDAPR